MKPAPFGYHDPSTTDEAVALLATLENARALAGGQSLVPMMNFRYAMPDHLIDLNGVAELDSVEIGDEIVLGAMVRQRRIEFSEELRNACPILIDALLKVGHRQTRNRGTIGGSLCNLDPSAELAAMMMLLDARMTARSARAARDIAMPDFAQGFMTTALEPDELLTHVAFTPWRKGHGYGFHEYARRHGDFAICSSGVLIEADARGSVARLAIVIGGVGPTPVRLKEAEVAAVGQPLSAELATYVASVAERVDAVSDVHVGADYRRHLAGVLTRRAMASATGKLKAAAHV
ncbi:MAG: molybdopterin dehydrogenase [Hyphomicrobiales bacterium]|nr:molybdopterin dehydrogenase [Hyphomicrobiales bacterium]